MLKRILPSLVALSLIREEAVAQLAPSPEATPEAIVQIYAARTARWRKPFAVHSWIATKEKNGTGYRTYHVIGWRLRRGLSVVVAGPGVPDAPWHGSLPEKLFDLRGAAAERAIPKIEAAARSYPYQNAYRAWPGPNSNTFISYIIRKTPELGVELPPNAIGKDWIETGHLFGMSESKTGVQLSVFGLLGVTVGLDEGIEMNVLGLSFGVDFLRPALKIPFVGRVGMKDSPIFDPPEEPALPGEPEPQKTITEIDTAS